MPSILINTKSYAKQQIRGVNIIKESKSTPAYLEHIALKETGMKITDNEKISRGFGHIQSNISFDPFARVFRADAKNIDSVLGKPYSIYYSSLEIDQLHLNPFISLHFNKKVSSIICNNSIKKDINNAIFVEAYYKAMLNNKSQLQAFEGAKSALIKHKQYNHPAFWAGIRFYIGGSIRQMLKNQ